MINRIIFAPALEKALECPANKLEKHFWSMMGE